MSKSLKNFIAELQELDEGSKKKWLFGLTTISVVIILLLWAMYLNVTVVAVDTRNAPTRVSNWNVFKTGLEVIGDKIEYGLANSYVFFHEKINDGNTFTVTK